MTSCSTPSIRNRCSVRVDIGFDIGFGIGFGFSVGFGFGIGFGFGMFGIGFGFGSSSWLKMLRLAWVAVPFSVGFTPNGARGAPTPVALHGSKHGWWCVHFRLPGGCHASCAAGGV